MICEWIANKIADILDPPTKWTHIKVTRSLRQTGRTTKMLLNAISTLLNGNDVLVIGYNFAICDRMYSQCNKLLNSLNIQIESKTISSMTVKLSNGVQTLKFNSHIVSNAKNNNSHLTCVYYDHYRGVNED